MRKGGQEEELRSHCGKKQNHKKYSANSKESQERGKKGQITDETENKLQEGGFNSTITVIILSANGLTLQLEDGE